MEDTGEIPTLPHTATSEQTLNISDSTSELFDETISHSHNVLLSTSSLKGGGVSRTLTLQLYLAAVGVSNKPGHEASLLTSLHEHGTGLLLFMLQSEDTQVGRLYLYPNYTQETISF